MTVILIGGSSHAGKSSLAKHMTDKRGWPLQSTDALARHPGRPWPEPRAEIAEFYSRLSPGTTHWLLLAHHENMRPMLDELIGETVLRNKNLLLEGSALRPEYMADWASATVHCVFLHADPAHIIERIHAGSRYHEQSPSQRALIDAFAARSLLDNDAALESARAHGIRTSSAATEDTAAGLLAGLFD
ncbi:hypothetical protein [Martelella limonii]|uniref:hypothetical protein n=1 Tax=Martelella limonii TaxID=1647649 RepID=UPI0015803EB9|nr:hypothetical protein [Martelella limonii]